ncbi:MAG: hypothetical protein HS105_11930 [Chloracidobacterium sp.]|nr:hypothetical protein [Chloracidobacterium sp.]MCO5332976.1 hypothetical protein [Pyrinomonadaceae bacterium]
MKVCPKCNGTSTGDNLFCPDDGTRYVKKSDAPNFSASRTDTFTFLCHLCDGINKQGAKFCKQCGVALKLQSNQQFEQTNVVSDTLQSPKGVTLPTTTEAKQPQKSNVLPIISVLLSIVVFGSLIYIVSNSNNSTASSAVANAANFPPSRNRSFNSIASNAASNASHAPPSSPNIGRTGRLTTNLIIRSNSNKNAENLGVHYKDSKVRILDEDSYSTDEGWSIWWKVRVLEEGCDAEDIRGCGSNNRNENVGEAAMEGWMNSRFIAID